MFSASATSTASESAMCDTSGGKCLTNTIWSIVGVRVHQFVFVRNGSQWNLVESNEGQLRSSQACPRYQDSRLLSLRKVIVA